MPTAFTVGPIADKLVALACELGGEVSRDFLRSRGYRLEAWGTGGVVNRRNAAALTSRGRGLRYRYI
jgi:hypothetical protein